jgi:subtilase family serine protease
MHKARIAALAAGAGLLAAAAMAAAAPAVTFAPVIRMAKTDQAGPLTTAKCVANLHIACYEPNQIRLAYHVGALFTAGITGKGTTIVIVDSFGSPTIRHDLAVFDKRYQVPAPPSFRIVTPAGKIPRFDPGNSDMVGWASETTLDVQYAHLLAPGAKILLVETPVSETEGVTGFPQIVKAEEWVINHHLGDVISQSFSATEGTFRNFAQLKPLRAAYIDAAAHHVTVLAASGDSGATDVMKDESTYYLHPVTSWPDSDPLVTAVGGTRLELNAGKFTSVAWNDTFNKPTNEYYDGDSGPAPFASGDSKSIYFARPAFQNGVKSMVGAHRGVPDISMSGACDGAVDTYTTFAGQGKGWSLICGTSEATPEFAAIVALADQVAGHPLGRINAKLYALSAANAAGIVDVTSGNNTVSFFQGTGRHTVHGFNAKRGYDLVTGVGTVDARKFVHELAGR